MIVKKASPGLDPGDNLRGLLEGSDITLQEYDEDRPLADQVADASVLLTRSIPVTREVIDSAPKLRLIQRFGVHVEAVDIEYATARGIPVANVPPDRSGGWSVAEHALFLMLAVGKLYRQSQASFATRTVGLPLTLGFRGKTVGLIGVGRTAGFLVPMVRSLGMRVIGIKRNPGPGEEAALGLDWLGGPGRLEEMLSQADVISVHLPLVEETRGYIGRREIGWMRDSAILINTSRGPIVDREALFEALLAGKLMGAGLDPWWEEPADPADPLLRLENVIATPHIAGCSVEARIEPARVVWENLISVREGRPPIYVLNGGVVSDVG